MNLKVLHLCTYGLYVVTSRMGERLNGQIANTIFQLTSDPPTIAVSINKANLTHEFIASSMVFVANILSTEAPMTFIGKWGFKSGRDINKLEGTNFKPGKTGAPIILDYCLGYIEAEVMKSVDVGTHTLFVGKVIDCDVTAEGEPMTYAFYHNVKKGKTPKKAATFIEEPAERKEQGMEGKALQKYRCTVCGYIYDPEQGDSDSGIAPGTSFEDLPDDWVCPVCGVGKDKFEPVT